MKKRLFILLSILLFTVGMSAQSKVRVYGYVIDTNNRGIELANVYVQNTTTGTTTNPNGYYELTLNVKDSGNVIPGHGGLLDRFDSMLLAAPVIFIFLSLLFDHIIK